MTDTTDNWQTHAACKGLTSLMFPEQGASKHSVNQAKAVCAGCPVSELCLEDALDNHQRFGIWAGRTPKELAQLRRERVVVKMRPRPNPIRHGEWESYERCRRTGSTCEPCREAMARYTNPTGDGKYVLDRGTG